MKQKVREKLVLGLGNDILTDDGIGTKLAWFLESKTQETSIHFETAPIGGMDLIDLICDYNTVIIIDAIKTADGVPGTVYYFNQVDYKETLHISHMHDLSFKMAIDFARNIGINITEKIMIIAVEILEDLVFSDDFSAPIAEKYDVIKREVENSMRQYFGLEGRNIES